MIMKRFWGLTGAAFAIVQTSFAEVDWTTSPVVINEGAKEDPVVVSEALEVTQKIYIGKSGKGAVKVVETGSINQPYTADRNLCLGDGAEDVGYLYAAGNVHAGYSIYVGNNGEGHLTIDGATVSDERFFYAGLAATAVGYVEVENEGELRIPREFVMGKAGKAYVRFADGTKMVCSRMFTLGRETSGHGELITGECTVSGTDTTPYVIGDAGTGLWFLKGTTVSSAKKGLIVRNVESAYGLLQGWGTVNPVSGGANLGSGTEPLRNNGLVVADGDGVDRTLQIYSTNAALAFSNTVENDSTNGWYAVDKGMLSMSVKAAVPAGEAGVYTWGEAEADDEIDLVNSARVTFKNITDTSTKQKGIYSFTGKLYASDRGDVPAGLPAGKTIAGIWKFDINGAYESADVEFRYDHVLAPKGVTLYQYDGTAWVKLAATALPNHRAKVEGVDPTKMFAAVAETSGLIVSLR